uniref:Uncharacterized protein n=1 Tax=Ditylenchus dipsaci TaxID=166011 RepID=A0A915ED50_9BILA
MLASPTLTMSHLTSHHSPSGRLKEANNVERNLCKTYNSKIDALYPIEVWNCYDLLLNKKPDNAHDGWRFLFNMQFPIANMSLSQFIFRLQHTKKETWQLAISTNQKTQIKRVYKSGKVMLKPGAS